MNSSAAERERERERERGREGEREVALSRFARGEAADSMRV
jgi:hypothetical protein